MEEDGHERDPYSVVEPEPSLNAPIGLWDIDLRPTLEPGARTLPSLPIPASFLRFSGSLRREVHLHDEGVLQRMQPV